MDDLLVRMGTDMVGRLTGPLTLRLYFQPTMATPFALRHGVRDARDGRPVYLWTICTKHEQRRHLIREGTKAIGKIFVLAIILDLMSDHGASPDLPRRDAHPRRLPVRVAASGLSTGSRGSGCTMTSLHRPSPLDRTLWLFATHEWNAYCTNVQPSRPESA